MGRIVKPDSRRSKALNHGQPLEMPASQSPRRPEWLSGDAGEVFENLVEETLDAGIPVQACDATLFALAAQIAVDYREATDVKLRGRIGRALAHLLDSIGATPAARARLGVLHRPAKKPSTATGKLLDMDRNRL